MRYAILTTPRTGSSVLCNCLDRTGVAGFQGGPGSYELRVNIAPGYDVKSEVDAFCKERATPNGVQGFKLMFPYLAAMLKHTSYPELEKSLIHDLDKVILLEREDVVAQAVSLFSARGRRLWSTLQKQKGLPELPPYDHVTIASYIARIEMGRAYFKTFLDENEFEYLYLTYEQNMRDWDATTRTIVSNFLGLNYAGKIVPQLKKLPDGGKQEYIERYREERNG